MYTYIHLEIIGLFCKRALGLFCKGALNIHVYPSYVQGHTSTECVPCTNMQQICDRYVGNKGKTPHILSPKKPTFFLQWFLHMWIWMCTRTHTHTHTHVHIHIKYFTHTCCLNAYTCVYTHTHTHTDAHAHTNVKISHTPAPTTAPHPSAPLEEISQKSANRQSDYAS